LVIKQQITLTLAWIRRDLADNKWRFIVECVCWVDSLACAVIVNSTVPDLPWSWLYPMWILGTLAYAWCAYSRGSFGMLATFLMLATIDSWGAVRWFMG
jgi:hypothetical protein